MLGPHLWPRVLREPALFPRDPRLQLRVSPRRESRRAEWDNHLHSGFPAWEILKDKVCRSRRRGASPGATLTLETREDGANREACPRTQPPRAPGEGRLRAGHGVLGATPPQLSLSGLPEPAGKVSLQCLLFPTKHHYKAGSEQPPSEPRPGPSLPRWMKARAVKVYV